MTSFDRPRYWIAGTAIAALGVLMTRVFAGMMDGALRPVLGAAGIIVAVAGLFVITIGTRRSARERRRATGDGQGGVGDSR